jgi:hypothetical protein
MNDPVNHPAHYVGAIETIDFIRDKLTPDEFVGYCKGNVLKYISRERLKNGKQDLEKAAVYLGWAIERYPTANRPRVTAVDFDGCLCENAWPEIGKANVEAIEELLKRKKNGEKIILWTCREGEALRKAIYWCMERGLSFDAVNENIPELKEFFGNDCRKVGADEYWDDKAKVVIAREGED